MFDDTQLRKEQVAGLYNKTAIRYGRIGPDVFPGEKHSQW